MSRKIYYLEATLSLGVYVADENNKLDSDPLSLEKQDIFFWYLGGPSAMSLDNQDIAFWYLGQPPESFVIGGYVDQKMYDKIEAKYGIKK